MRTLHHIVDELSAGAQGGTEAGPRRMHMVLHVPLCEYASQPESVCQRARGERMSE